MINKEVGSLTKAVGDIADGNTIMIGGFGSAGTPYNLRDALVQLAARDLTVIANAYSQYDVLLNRGLIRRAITSFPLPPDTTTILDVQQRYRSGEFEVETVPQGTLAERIRAGGAGIAAFYTPVGSGTVVAEGKETRILAGRTHLLEHALRADFALIRAHVADTAGNLIYRGASRNYGPLMAMAARTTIVEVERIVPAGELDPEMVVTPGIFVQRIICLPKQVVWSFKQARQARAAAT